MTPDLMNAGNRKENRKQDGTPDRNETVPNTFHSVNSAFTPVRSSRQSWLQIGARMETPQMQTQPFGMGNPLKRQSTDNLDNYLEVVQKLMKQSPINQDNPKEQLHNTTGELGKGTVSDEKKNPPAAEFHSAIGKSLKRSWIRISQLLCVGKPNAEQQAIINGARILPFQSLPLRLISPRIARRRDIFNAVYQLLSHVVPYNSGLPLRNALAFLRTIFWDGKDYHFHGELFRHLTVQPEYDVVEKFYDD
ncbi:unnamed protein product [Caenorhabditis sp. 36 PRJEB53466]|nr:unnamed protein product [Caenorhabditis sp. 36 PRJEB53466]